MSEEALFRNIQTGWARLAGELARRDPAQDASLAEAAARKATLDRLFLQICRHLAVEAPASLVGPPADVPARGDKWNASPIRDFSGIRPSAILGKVHERLLGCRLQLLKDATAAARRSNHLRKARGVFYTPDFVTKYVAEGALAGRAWRSDDPPSSPAILDPACGCGAFLLAAADALRGQGAAPEELAGSIHGMDLDPVAVLAARRSLWLKIVVETGQPLRPQAASEVARRLVENLVSTDALADEAVASRTGRFDLLLGNPPYRRELNAKSLLDRIATTRLGRHWRTARMDLWYYFVFRGLELLRPGGVLSFIVNSYWTTGRGAEKLIDVLRGACHLEEIVLLDRCRVFPGVSGRHMIFRLVKGGNGATRICRPASPAPADAEPLLRGTAPFECFVKSPAELFHNGRLDLEPVCPSRLESLDRWPPLGSLGRVRQGIAENPASVTRKANEAHGNRWRVGEGVFSLTRKEAASLDLASQEQDLLRPYHDLCDLDRYWLADGPSRLLIYATPLTCPDIDRFPAIRRHLSRFRPILAARRETRQGARPWWQLHWPRDEAIWTAPAKLLSVQMGRRPAFVPATRPVYVPFSVNVVVPADDTREHVHYLAALLNSRLLWDWFRRHAKHRGVGLEINGNVLARAPIRTIDFTDPADAARHDRLVERVGQMLGLSQRLRQTAGEKEREEIERRQIAIDNQIDRQVEELYGVETAGAPFAPLECGDSSPL